MRHRSGAIWSAWIPLVALAMASLAVASERAGGVQPGQPIKSAGATTQPVGWASVDGGTTGGRGGPAATVREAESFVRHVQGDEPAVVQVAGVIRLVDDARIGSNKTIIGLGADATITGAGLRLRRVQNVIISNLTITDVKGDAIGLDGSRRVWVDHCDLSHGGDGLFDMKHGSDLVTVSWNHFHHHHKSSLVGHSDKPAALVEDKGKLRVTYHHNFFDGTQTRHPRVRVGEPVHIFNNFYRGNDYGIASLMDAGVIVEGNYFQRVKNPTHTLYGESKEPGRLVERGNVYVDSGKPTTRGTVVEAKNFYNYTLDKARDVPRIVSEEAGVGKLAP